MLRIVGEVIAVLVAIYIVYNLLTGAVHIYNRLQCLRNSLKQARANVENVLKARDGILEKNMDLLDDYKAYEGDTNRIQGMADVTCASQGGFMQSSHQMYLKGNSSYDHQFESIKQLESDLVEAQANYDNAVTAYNNARSVFPAIIIAIACGFHQETIYSPELVRAQNNQIQSEDAAVGTKSETKVALETEQVPVVEAVTKSVNRQRYLPMAIGDIRRADVGKSVSVSGTISSLVETEKALFFIISEEEAQIKAVIFGYKNKGLNLVNDQYMSNIQGTVNFYNKQLQIKVHAMEA